MMTQLDGLARRSGVLSLDLTLPLVTASPQDVGANGSRIPSAIAQVAAPNSYRCAKKEAGFERDAPENGRRPKWTSADLIGLVSF